MCSTKCTITCWHYRLKWHYNFLLILYLNFSFDFRLFLLSLCLSVHDDALLWRLTSFYLKFICTKVEQYGDPGPHISINRLIIISYLPIFIFLLLTRTHFFLFFVLSFYHRFIQRIDKNTSTIPSEFKNRSMLLIADYYYWFAPFGRLWNMWSMLVCAVCYECSASLNSAPLVTHAHWYQFASLFLFEIRLFSLFRCVIVWL